MTPVAWFDGIAIVIILGSALFAFGKVRERRRKARREAFLRNRQYHDHARGEWRRGSDGDLPSQE